MEATIPRRPATGVEETTAGDGHLDMTSQDHLAASTITVLPDDKHTKDSLQTFAAYLIPAEVLVTESEESLVLGGLVLEPTYLKRGQFRRIGLLMVADYWFDPIESPSDEMDPSSSQKPRFEPLFSKQEEYSAQVVLNDRYYNGVVSRTLLERYKDVGFHAPKITAFVNAVAKKMPMDMESGELEEILYEQIDSDRYSVFHII